jgi:hypothetical protein
MAFYSKPDPLTAAIDGRPKLVKLVQDAEAQLGAETLAVNSLVGVDDATVEKAEARVTEKNALVQRRLLHLENADIEIARLKAEQDKAADQKQRNQTAIDCHKLIEALAETGDAMGAAAKRLSGIAARIVPIAPEAGGLQSFADVAEQQIPEAVALLSRLIREHAAAVLRRDAPPTVKKPEAPIVPAVVAEPVRMDLFAMRSVKYVDPDSGKLIVVQKFQDGVFPPSYAKVAIEQKVAVRVSDPVRKQHHGTTPGHANAELAFDLDAAMHEPKAAAIDPIMASVPTSPTSPFTVVDRGPAIQIKVSR